LFYFWQDEDDILLCKHHAGPVVHAAVAEYIEKGGRDMNNPSTTHFSRHEVRKRRDLIHDVEDTSKSKKRQTQQGNEKILLLDLSKTKMVKAPSNGRELTNLQIREST